MTDDPKPKGRGGFGSMSPERLKEVAAHGGRSVKAENRHLYANKDRAREIGRLGGFAKAAAAKAKKDEADGG